MKRCWHRACIIKRSRNSRSFLRERERIELNMYRKSSIDNRPNEQNPIEINETIPPIFFSLLVYSPIEWKRVPLLIDTTGMLTNRRPTAIPIWPGVKGSFNLFVAVKKKKSQSRHGNNQCVSVDGCQMGSKVIFYLKHDAKKIVFPLIRFTLGHRNVSRQINSSIERENVIFFSRVWRKFSPIKTRPSVSTPRSKCW